MLLEVFFSILLSLAYARIISLDPFDFSCPQSGLKLEEQVGGGDSEHRPVVPVPPNPVRFTSEAHPLPIIISSCHNPCRQHCENIVLPLIEPNLGMTMDYFEYDGVVSDDGQGYYCSDSGVYKIRSSPFESWSPPAKNEFLDHMKYNLIGLQFYEIPDSGSLSIEYKVQVQVTGLHEQPFPEDAIADSNDVRLANAGFWAIDLDTGLQLGFLVTNDHIYGYYQRLPTARDRLGDYAAFAMIIPLAERCNEDVNRLQLIFEGRGKRALFLVDDVEKYHVNYLGFVQDPRLLVLDQSGVPELVWPRAVQLLFGTNTMLDFYPAATNPACRNPYEDIEVCGLPHHLVALVRTANRSAVPMYDPSSGGAIPASYIDSNGRQECEHIWGQGCDIDIHSIKVTTVNCCA